MTIFCVGLIFVDASVIIVAPAKGLPGRNTHKRGFTQMWQRDKTVISFLGEKSRCSNLTEKDWYILLESRREQLRKEFSSVTFPVLGSMRCLSGRRWSSDSEMNHTIEADKHEIKDEKMRKLLDLRGLFHLVKRIRGEIKGRVTVAQDEAVCIHDGAYFLWGLGSHGYWEILEIHYSEGYYFDTGTYEKARAIVQQRTVHAEDIVELGTTPRNMMEELTKDWERIVNRRRELCQRAEKTYHTMLGEDAILRYSHDPIEIAQREARR